MSKEELSLHEKYFMKTLYDEDLVLSYKFTEKEFGGRSEIDNLVEALQRRGVYIRDGAGIEEINGILEDTKLHQDHYADIRLTTDGSVIKVNRMILEEAHKECPHIFSNSEAAGKALKELEEFKRRVWERLHPGDSQPTPLSLGMSGLNSNPLEWQKGRDREMLLRVREGVSLYLQMDLNELWAYLGESKSEIVDEQSPDAGGKYEYSKPRERFVENIIKLRSMPLLKKWRGALYKKIGIPLEAPAQAITPATGGIDLTRDKMPVKVTGAGPGVQFNFDPAMIARLQAAGGITPVILDIQPMTTSVAEFLGKKTLTALPLPR